MRSLHHMQVYAVKAETSASTLVLVLPQQFQSVSFNAVLDESVDQTLTVAVVNDQHLSAMRLRNLEN